MRVLISRLRSVGIVRGVVLLLGCFVTVVVVGLLLVALYTRTNPLAAKLSREQANTAKHIVNDVTELNPIQTQGIIVPLTNEDIIEAVQTHEKVSIGGGRNSMGGQTATESAVQLDMRQFTKVLAFSTTTKEITVQTGATWHDIQEYIDPYNLSVQIMQTYSNFTVGGSLSVNVHGRYVAQGPVILSVKSFRIVLADGSLVEASPTEHTDIFYSAIGGMGGIGVITDATLSLADNVNVERSRELMKTTDYTTYFKSHVLGNPNVLFHNGDMYPPDFNTVSGVSWVVTDKQPTTADRLIPQRQDYWKERIAWIVMSEWPYGRWIRQHILDPWVYRDTPVHTRNYEASYDIAELEPNSRDTSTYVLQEYFIPVQSFDTWVPKMKKVFADNNVNVLNVSIRFAHGDPGAKLAWARGDTFAFVVYYKQGTDQKAKESVQTWTREMIDQVISVNGTYYLPYQILATEDQFHRAYPQALDYFTIKKALDPTNKFSNKLWDQYYTPEKLEGHMSDAREVSFASTTPEYYRPFDQSVLSLPEWYIVYSADEYAHTLRDSLPSHFTYFKANSTYWDQYAVVTNIVGDSPASHDYVSVLNVIGWSFSAENAVKGVYEHSVGRLFELIAGEVQVPEDIYAATVAENYATFLYDYPWYDFSYKHALFGLWNVDATSTPLRQWPRRAERKIVLSGEYTVKMVYAGVIRMVTHATFGVQNDVVYATVSDDGGQTYRIISAPHYQPFTRTLLAALDEQKDNLEFRILNISGNTEILFTYRDAVGTPAVMPSTEVVRDTEVQSLTEGVAQAIDRITVRVSVEDIPKLYSVLQARGISIDHVYDY
jgi:FAD/FMN-containing dehydrogenase